MQKLNDKELRDLAQSAYWQPIVQQACIAHALTPATLAATLDISDSALTAISEGIATPTPEQQVKLLLLCTSDPCFALAVTYGSMLEKFVAHPDIDKPHYRDATTNTRQWLLKAQPSIGPHFISLGSQAATHFSRFGITIKLERHARTSQLLLRFVPADFIFYNLHRINSNPVFDELLRRLHCAGFAAQLEAHILAARQARRFKGISKGGAIHWSVPPTGHGLEADHISGAFLVVKGLPRGYDLELRDFIVSTLTKHVKHLPKMGEMTGHELAQVQLTSAEYADKAQQEQNK